MTVDKDAPETLRSTPAIVAEKLRDEIVRGHIGPGERINVREFGRRLEVSHIPIREAVRLLEAEGFLETRPNVGAVAAGMSLQELDDVYDLRRMIEPVVARRAAESMTEERVARVRRAFAELKLCESRADGLDSDIIVAHRNFHWEMLTGSCSALIERTLMGLWHISERYLRRTRGAALPIADEQHAKMVKLCEQRNGEALEELLTEHLHLTANALRLLYSEDAHT